jgi:hypothetical protein
MNANAGCWHFSELGTTTRNKPHTTNPTGMDHRKPNRYGAIGGLCRSYKNHVISVWINPKAMEHRDDR